MSPMFGLETDESVKVESAKAIGRKGPGGRKTADKGAGKAAAGKKAAASKGAAPEKIPPAVNTRSNSTTEPEDLTLLQQINESLLAAKKGKRS
jgi:hypothetical protein